MRRRRRQLVNREGPACRVERAALDSSNTNVGVAKRAASDIAYLIGGQAPPEAVRRHREPSGVREARQASTDSIRHDIWPHLVLRHVSSAVGRPVRAARGPSARLFACPVVHVELSDRHAVGAAEFLLCIAHSPAFPCSREFPGIFDVVRRLIRHRTFSHSAALPDRVCLWSGGSSGAARPGRRRRSRGDCHNRRSAPCVSESSEPE
jgi:hypothetical protein